MTSTHRSPAATLRDRVVGRLRRTRNASVERLGDWAFNRRSLALALRRTHVLCIGDSHLRVMDNVAVPGVRFRVKPLEGATASGVRNPNSQTQSREVFAKWLRRAKPWQEVLVQLGEVDCGFVIWYRAERYGIAMAEQLERTLDSYSAFVESVAAMGFRRVIVLSAPLPTIGDSPSEWGEVANLRQAVTTKRADRTELTLRFNALLGERCAAIGVEFVDATSSQLDPRTGVIDSRFLRPTHHDHHLADAPYAQLIAGELRRLWR